MLCTAWQQIWRWILAHHYMLLLPRTAEQAICVRLSSKHTTLLVLPSVIGCRSREGRCSFQGSSPGLAAGSSSLRASAASGAAGSKPTAGGGFAPATIVSVCQNCFNRSIIACFMACHCLCCNAWQHGRSLHSADVVQSRLHNVIVQRGQALISL